MINKYNLSINYEAGTDEAGAGCLAGPVVAAAVILPYDFYHIDLNDSKKLTAKKREILFDIIKKESIQYSIAEISNDIIDDINILQARFKAMDVSVKKISEHIRPDHLIVDGNRFYKTYDIPFTCIVKGDEKYTSIAAASILAKVYRDDIMRDLHNKYPEYGWDSNMGYGTKKHIEAIKNYGLTSFHRISFTKNII